MNPLNNKRNYISPKHARDLLKFDHQSQLNNILDKPGNKKRLIRVWNVSPENGHIRLFYMPDVLNAKKQFDKEDK